MKGKVTFKLVEKDKGWRKVVVNAKALSGPHVRVGLNEGAEPYARSEPTAKGGRVRAEGPVLPAKPGEEVDVVLVGIWHEFGTSRMPARSWLRATVLDSGNARKYEKMIWGGLVEVLEGRKKVEQILGEVGFEAANDMRNRILRRLVVPPTSPGVMAGKVNKTTLFESGHLLRNITHKVYPSGGGELTTAETSAGTFV